MDRKIEGINVKVTRIFIEIAMRINKEKKKHTYGSSGWGGGAVAILNLPEQQYL